MKHIKGDYDMGEPRTISWEELLALTHHENEPLFTKKAEPSTPMEEKAEEVDVIDKTIWLPNQEDGQ